MVFMSTQIEGSGFTFHNLKSSSGDFNLQGKYEKASGKSSRVTIPGFEHIAFAATTFDPGDPSLITRLSIKTNNYREKATPSH